MTADEMRATESFVTIKYINNTLSETNLWVIISLLLCQEVNF